MWNEQQDTGCSPTCTSGGLAAAPAQNELCTRRHRLLRVTLEQLETRTLTSSWLMSPRLETGSLLPNRRHKQQLVALPATRSDQSEKPARGKLGRGEIMGSFTWRPARLHFTSQQLNVGTTSQNKPTTKSTTFSEVFVLLLPCIPRELWENPASSDLPVKE